MSVPPHHPPRQTQRAFSLLELLLVLLLISIAAALAAPSFASMLQDSQFAQSRQLLHSAYLYARSEAVKRETEVQLSLEQDMLVVRRRSDAHEFRRFALTLSDIELQASPALTISPLGGANAVRWQLRGPGGRVGCLEVLGSGQSDLRSQPCA